MKIRLLAQSRVGRNGGDDETRTRDLCRDRVAVLGLTTTYTYAGTAKITCKSHKTPQPVGWVVGWKIRPSGPCPSAFQII